MRHNTIIVAAAAVGFTATAALGQSINIDFSDGAHAVPSDYAGAGQPGVWNTPESGDTLVNLDGQPIAASVVFWSGGLLSTELSDADDTHAPLLNDGIGGTGDLLNLIQFSDLLPGEYEIIVYGWNPLYPQDLTSVILGDFATHEVIGGAWPGSLIEGVTHTTLHWNVSETGVFEVSWSGGIWGHDGFINGMQLQHLEEASIVGDLNGDGVVNINDLLIVLNNWGECDDCDDCFGDITGDCTVNVDDLLIILNNWG